MQQPTLDNYIKILIAHLVNEGMSPEDAIKAMDHLLGELCRKYEQLRGNSGDEVIDKVYGHTFNRSDNYFLEKRKKFFNSGYGFACGLDGGHLPRLGKTLREYIERMDNRV